MKGTRSGYFSLISVMVASMRSPAGRTICCGSSWDLICEFVKLLPQNAITAPAPNTTIMTT